MQSEYECLTHLASQMPGQIQPFELPKNSENGVPEAIVSKYIPHMYCPGKGQVISDISQRIKDWNEKKPGIYFPQPYGLPGQKNEIPIPARFPTYRELVYQ